MTIWAMAISLLLSRSASSRSTCGVARREQYEPANGAEQLGLNMISGSQRFDDIKAALIYRAKVDQYLLVEPPPAVRTYRHDPTAEKEAI